jgi:hypothetical protein
MGFPSGKINKLGKVSVTIKANVQLDCSLWLPKGCPWKSRETEVNHRCIKEIELAIKFKSVLGCKEFGFLQELVKQRFIQVCRLAFMARAKVAREPFLMPRW